MFKNKNVLVAGGSGLIGRQLVNLLLKEGAKVSVADLKSFDSQDVNFINLDLTNYDNCMIACHKIDFVFNLLCAKGSPQAMRERPASHFDPMILFNTNLMRAAHDCSVEKYLYASTVGVYSPAPVFYEDSVWGTEPSDNDKFAGWAKRMGELQAQAYELEHGWSDISIVRPANTYGPYDNFSSDSSMVIPSLIRKALSGKKTIELWGDGTNIRDFIHSTDVAKGMMIVMEKSPGPGYPVNLGSSSGYSIKDLLSIILDNIENPPDVIWDKDRQSGDQMRVMDTKRAESLGFKPSIGLEEGIGDLIKWYIENEKKY
jgi:GDP-L-fucose synthase